MCEKENVVTLKYESLDCPCCTSPEYRLLKEKTGIQVQFNERETAWKFKNRIVICRQCGHVYLNPTPTEKDLANYYSAGMTLYDDSSSFSIEKRIDVLTTVLSLIKHRRKTVPTSGGGTLIVR